MVGDKMPPKIPSKLNLCPIIESVFEIRFDSDFDANIVFALIYSVLKDDFPKVESLPLSGLPPKQLDSDPDLKYQPAYKLHYKEDCGKVIQIGAKMIGFSFASDYTGWSHFSSFIIQYLQIIKTTNVFSKIVRVGFRVINFIEGDVFLEDKIRLIIKLGEDNIPYKDTSLRTMFTEGVIFSNVYIINHASLNKSQVKKIGSVIDIDTFSSECEQFLENPQGPLDRVHEVEKKVFFNLLTESYIKSLQPEYE